MIFPDLRALDTHIKAGALLPVYLLYGEENRQIEAARERLVKTAVPDGDSMNLLRCDGSGEVDWDGIADLLWSMSFVPGRRCAVVDDLNPSALGSVGMNKLTELLSSPAEDGLLILTVRNSARQLAKKEAAAAELLTLCDKAGGVCRFAAMTRGDVAKFARQTALRLGCVLEPEEAALLADYCNLDSLRLRQEVEKLAAYHGYTGKILKEDIEALVAPTVDANVFQLGDKVLRGDFNGAMAIVDDLLFLQERPESILTILTMSFVDYYRAAAVRRAGVTDATARKELGYGGSYRFTKALEQCGRLSRPALEGSLEILADADARMKQSAADGRTVLEVTILRLIELLRRERA